MQYGKDFIGIGAWGLILNEKGQLLFIRKIGNTYWEQVGGKVEFGETLEAALKREVMEECGIEIEIKRLLGYDQVFKPYIICL